MSETPLARLMHDEPGLEELGMTLRDVGGRASRVLDVTKLQRGVYRVSLATPSRTLSLVVKRLSPSVAHRTQLALERWLPAAGLEHAAPALVGVAAERAGGKVWHLYEDLGAATLESADAAPAALEAVTRLVATIHARFAHNPALAECRLWGDDHGIGFYDSSVRDSISAVSALLADTAARGDATVAAERLLAQLERLAEERDERVRCLAELGGPETLLHGDLWPKNAVVSGTIKQRVRLLDWDKVGPGSFSYDLSALALRVPARARVAVMGCYRRAAADHGMHLPDDADLNVLFATAECARLANIAIWPALEALEHGRRSALDELAEIDQWLERLRPRCVA